MTIRPLISYCIKFCFHLLILGHFVHACHWVVNQQSVRDHWYSILCLIWGWVTCLSVFIVKNFDVRQNSFCFCLKEDMCMYAQTNCQDHMSDIYENINKFIQLVLDHWSPTIIDFIKIRQNPIITKYKKGDRGLYFQVKHGPPVKHFKDVETIL